MPVPAAVKLALGPRYVIADRRIAARQVSGRVSFGEAVGLRSRVGPGNSARDERLAGLIALHVLRECPVRLHPGRVPTPPQTVLPEVASRGFCLPLSGACSSRTTAGNQDTPTTCWTPRQYGSPSQLTQVHRQASGVVRRAAARRPHPHRYMTAVATGASTPNRPHLQDTLA